MKVIVKSVYDAFDYVMEHYYPPQMEEFAVRNDSYAVISIQDSHTGGLGFTFDENHFCKGVLTLVFDDVWKDVDGAVTFDEEMAEKIIDFIGSLPEVQTLLIHCYGGQSRSMAVGAFAEHMLGRDNSRYFEEASPNLLVYEMLMKTFERKSGN